jgi:toxin ParE1/3/4
LAERDLIGIWHSIADRDAANATKFLHALDVRISSLNDFPDRGAARPEFGRGVRVLIEGKYVIFYRKIKANVEILRVVHGAMDLEKLSLT